MSRSMPDERPPRSFRVRPADFSKELAGFSPEARRLLAQVIGVHLVPEELPPVSFAPELLHVAQPLVDAGLVQVASEAEQHAFDADARWGVVAPGLLAVGLDTRLIGAVLALIGGRTVNGGAWYRLLLDGDPHVRTFQVQGGPI